MARSSICVDSVVVLRKSEDLSDRFEPCSDRPLTGWQASGVRGVVLEVDSEKSARPVQVHFKGTGVTAWFAKSNLKVLKVG